MVVAPVYGHWYTFQGIIHGLCSNNMDCVVQATLTWVL